MPSELIRQARVLDPVSNTDRIADVLIVDGIIEEIADQITDIPQDSRAELQVCDRPGLILGPGLVDLYSHSGEPGFESRETLNSLAQAAEAGGFTRLAILPDTDPAVDSPDTLERLRSQAKHISPASLQLYYWGALTLGVQGQHLTELAELADSGVVGFADGQPLTNSTLLCRMLEYIAPLSKPIALWCCDTGLTGNGVVREGLDSMRLGLPGIPAMAENTAIATLLEYVDVLRTPVHLMRVSTARSVELIREAKARGLPITASTTWMHLLLNTKALESYDPGLHLAPPLGTPADQAALLQGIRDSVIDAIAIDHTPYTYEEKTVAFSEAPAGAIGLELALPLLWQTLVVSDVCSALTLWRSLSTNPTHCLAQAPVALSPGQVAELTLFDPEQPWRVDRSTLHSRASNTPWLGQEIVGRVVKSWGLGVR
jgi:dihydroorotase